LFDFSATPSPGRRVCTARVYHRQTSPSVTSTRPVTNTASSLLAKFHRFPFPNFKIERKGRPVLPRARGTVPTFNLPLPYHWHRHIFSESVKVLAPVTKPVVDSDRHLSLDLVASAGSSTFIVYLLTSLLPSRALSESPVWLPVAYVLHATSTNGGGINSQAPTCNSLRSPE
jgi:hypothetical protein